MSINVRVLNDFVGHVVKLVVATTYNDRAASGVLDLLHTVLLPRKLTVVEGPRVFLLLMELRAPQWTELRYPRCRSCWLIDLRLTGHIFLLVFALRVLTGLELHSQVLETNHLELEWVGFKFCI